jgi:hypothetical protein
VSCCARLCHSRRSSSSSPGNGPPIGRLAAASSVQL